MGTLNKLSFHGNGSSHSLTPPSEAFLLLTYSLHKVHGKVTHIV